MTEDGDRLRAPAIRIEYAGMSVRVMYFMIYRWRSAWLPGC